METIKDMLKTHPKFNKEKLEELHRTITELLTCASICSICADACLSEGKKELEECIKKNLLCAEICQTSALALSSTVQSEGALAALMGTCMKICQVCAEECQKHGEEMHHCRICSETCFKCRDACQALLKNDL